MKRVTHETSWLLGGKKCYLSLGRVWLLLLLLPLLLLLLLLVDSIASQQQQASNNNNNNNQASVGQKPQNYLETSRQISGILDRFMSLGYDKRVRPNYGGPPVEVNVTMRILSISSVSEVMMDFTADFYFRQTWVDPRLAFKKLGDIQTLYVGAEVSKKIWLPDTFFGNEKLAYFHEATTPNVFLRIDHSGEVYRSIRLTVTSSCPMNLQYFPMDRQRCTIEAESYGYNVKDIIYRWARKETAVERDKEISLPQFDIVKTVQKYRLEELSSGTYSRLIAEIHFARRMGYYLIQIYIPSSLIVVISWVSFWLHRNASPARVQLGVTTVLTMTTLMSSTNAALPKISYVKSIDIFLGTCFIMVFAALLEYATVGYLGKRIAMRKAQVQHAQSQAQARLFAQLQAQGAQGDSIPPTASSTVLPTGAAAAGATSSSTGSVPIFGPSPLDPSATAGLAPSGGNNGATSVNSPLLAAQVQHQAALLSQFASQLVANSQQQQQQPISEQLASPSPPPPFVQSPRPPERSSGARRACCAQPRPSGCRLAGNCNHHHQQQQQPVYERARQQAAASCAACSHSRLLQTSAGSTCLCCHYDYEHDGDNDTFQPPGHAHHHHQSSRTLPRNQTFSPNEHDDKTNNSTAAAAPISRQTRCSHSDLKLIGHQQQQQHCNHNNNSQFIAPDLLIAQQPPRSSLKANSQMFDSAATRTLPPSYSCNQSASHGLKLPAPSCGSATGGASAVATAAAATFVNLHRRNKGLPPSTNPNFAKFAWMGQYNRSIETIFGIRPSDIDKYSRVVFPVCFVCFQLMYWIVYLHISAFLESEQQQQQQLTP